MFNIYIYFGLNKLNKHEVTQLVGDGGGASQVAPQ